MEPLRESARAKVNLTLKVLGRRNDGFHEISSLVAFADLHDTLELLPGDDLALSISGPFASDLSETDNLVLDAARLVMKRCPGAWAGRVTLVKNLPVAAGLGGGSADAAAALRLFMRSNAGKVTKEVISDLAEELGSDVTACLESRAAWMSGRGEKLSYLSDLMELSAILVNSGTPLGAGKVYEALNAPEHSSGTRCNPEEFATREELISYIGETGNDLTDPALKMAPVIGEVLKAIGDTEGCVLAQMTGSGATCFGLYDDMETAGRARDKIARSHPGWWTAVAIMS